MKLIDNLGVETGSFTTKLGSAAIITTMIYKYKKLAPALYIASVVELGAVVYNLYIV